MQVVDQFSDATTVQCRDKLHWLIERRKRIHASDVAAIFGVGYSNANALTVWEEKTRDCLIPQQITDRKLEIGLILEPAIRELFALETGIEVIPPEPWTIHVSTDHDWVAATLDGQIVTDEYGLCPFEGKNVGQWNAADWADNQSPLKFQVQAQVQMFVTGASACPVAGLIGGNDIEVRWIERNDRFLEVMVSRLESFWRCVQERRMPEIDDTIATSKAISRLFPDDDGTAIPLPEEARNWARIRDWAKHHAKVCNRIATGAENQLKVAIGDHAYGVIGDQVFSFRKQRRKSYEVPESEFRVFRPLKSLPKGIALKDDERHESDVRLVSRKSSYAKEKKQLFNQSDRCMWCNKQLTLTTATVDHIVPLARGGSNRIENLGLACGQCNNARGDLD